MKNGNGIDPGEPHVTKYYPFAVPKGIEDAIFNSYATGTNANDELDVLSRFTINS